jgi:hypothetical protein
LAPNRQFLFDDHAQPQAHAARHLLSQPSPIQYKRPRQTRQGDQRRIRSDERIGANIGAIFEEAIIVAGIGSCANICLGADIRVADSSARRSTFAPALRFAFLISTKFPTLVSSGKLGPRS